MDSFEVESCVRGHHVYKSKWTLTLGEELGVSEKKIMRVTRSQLQSCGGMSSLDTFRGRYRPLLPFSYVGTQQHPVHYHRREAPFC